MEGIDGIYIAKAAAAIGAAIAMGVGAIGPALGQGLVGMKACESIGKNSESAKEVRAAMMIAMGMVETSAIYAFIVALFLIFFGAK